jgi:hypothetical protein
MRPKGHFGQALAFDRPLPENRCLGLHGLVECLAGAYGGRSDQAISFHILGEGGSTTRNGEQDLAGADVTVQ